jgi:hypothetical protein
MELRPHLRNCPGCRATRKALQGSSEPLSAVLPIPLVGIAAAGQDQLTHVLTRLYETIAAGFHERAIYSFTKAQTAVEAASAGKLAAVAASAAAVAGGGYATVERTIPTSRHDKPAKSATHNPAPKATPPVPVAVRSAPPVRRAAPVRPKRTIDEFGHRSARQSSNQSPEFEPINEQDTQFTSAAAAGEPDVTPPPPPPPAPPRSSPEFGGADGAPEFGG